MKGYDHHQYKNFIISLRFGLFGLPEYKIKKYVQGKYFVLTHRNLYKKNCGSLSEMLYLACTYIDSNEKILNDRFKIAFTEYAEKVYKNPENFIQNDINIDYFMKCHCKINGISFKAAS